MSWWSRLHDRDRLERELSSEIVDHVERHVADLVARGLNEPEARRRAQIELGGAEQVKEACRDARGTRWLEDLGSDLRYAWRGLRQRPAFAAVAVLSLGLGIGANTALFSIMENLIRRSLPVREPGRLALLEGSWTNPIWEQIRDREHDLFDGAVAWSGADFDLAAGGEENRVNGLFVSGSFFEVFGVPARLGRTILPSDDRRHAGTDGLVAVLSDGFWKRHYGGDPGVVGRTLQLNRAVFTVVGVAPPGFLGPEVGESFDVAVPIAAYPIVQPPLNALDDRNYWWLEVVARRKHGQTLAEAAAALRAVQAPIRAATLPPGQTAEELADYLREPFRLVPAAAGTSALRDRYRRPLFTILAIAILVLLVACANVANLQLARGNERRHEFRLRLALGASRWRVTRQLLTESVLIAGLGALLGLAFAVWGSRLLVRHLSNSGPPALGLPVDAAVLVFTGAVAVLTALLFGTLPAWRAGRSDAEGAAWREPPRGAAGMSGGASGALIVVQVAISLVLLVAAGLFVRTLVAITNRDLGFRSQGVLVVSLYAWQSGISVDRFVSLADRIRTSVAELPGVASAGLSDVTPVSGSSWREQFEVPGSGRGSERAFVHIVSRGWLSVYGTPRLAGRDFLERDHAESPPVALINRAFARRIFGDKTPLGQTIRTTTGIYLAPMEVVGIVEDAVYRDLREDHAPTIYVPFAQGMKAVTAPQASLSIRVRTGLPSRLTSAVVAAVARIDPRMTLRFRTLSDQIDATLVRERLVAMLSGFFGALAVLLAAVGLYGVTSHAVTRRRAEIGVRMALGADASRVVRMMLGRVVGLVLVGVLAGAAVSAWASRFVAALLYGLRPGDAFTIAAAASLLSAISIIAAYLPAREAARIDPAKVLRDS